MTSDNTTCPETHPATVATPSLARTGGSFFKKRMIVEFLRGTEKSWIYQAKEGYSYLVPFIMYRQMDYILWV
jgi:hypothetical protein